MIKLLVYLRRVVSKRSYLQTLLYGIFLSAFLGVATSYAQNEKDETITAFKEFVANKDFNSANFYFSSGLINPATLDTSQIFYDIYHRVHWRQRAAALPEITTLFAYLNQIRTIDLNRPFNCTRQDSRREIRKCWLVNDLSTGMPISVFKFFRERGLELNAVHKGFVPATYDIIDRFGLVYSLADIQALSWLGMAFGDELYDSVELAAHRERSYSYGNVAVVNRPTLRMPHNYLSIPKFNFLDALVVALANGDNSRSDVRESIRDDSLCQYVVFAAGSFRPSFDYLRYVLENRANFRAGRIGERKRSGNTTIDPFPASCVSLIAGMAQNHGQLDAVVSFFGAKGDVETARWLLSMRPAQPGAAPNSPSRKSPQPEPGSNQPQNNTNG
ncbi:MAG: hypothetical protein AAGF54_14530 [Pseudomonadota bacterium]